MNEPDATSPTPPRSAVALHTRRCVRHGTREAAARCPGCGAYFCRECVSEFGGKALCADCLAKMAKRPPTVVRRWTAARESLRLAGAIVVTWASFYVLGRLAAKLPASFHEDSVWAAENADDEP